MSTTKVQQQKHICLLIMRISAGSATLLICLPAHSRDDTDRLGLKETEK